MFYRLFTDHSRQALPLENLYAGPQRTACWIIGGGPSLARLPISKIVASPIPKFAINLAGAGLLRPTFWTSYDPTARFQRSIYLDPSIQKFVHTCRAMDLIPETTFKVCEAPNLVCLDRMRGRGFFDFPTAPAHTVTRPGSLPPGDLQPGITDWQDSLIQAIDIAYRLGFRKLYLAGCELYIPPPLPLLELARRHQVNYQEREPLTRFLQHCRQAGIAKETLERHRISAQYHFEEEKPIAAAVQTDEHYYRVTQYLRLARRAMSLAGLELNSATPHSRLNDYFPLIRIDDIVQQLEVEVGNPQQETTLGRYTSQSSRQPAELMPMRDYRPHNWNPANAPIAERPVAVREAQHVDEVEIPQEEG